MLLTQDQEMIRDAVRAFAKEELWPHAARWDREHTFPKEAHQGLAALGAYGICVPEEYGGAGLDYLSLALVLEEIAAGGGDHPIPLLAVLPDEFQPDAARGTEHEHVGHPTP